MSAEPPFAAGDLDPGHRQLRLFVIVDLAFSVVAAIAVLVLSWALPPSPAYPLVIALPALGAVAMARALPPLQRRDATATVRWMSAANWGLAVAVASVVTFLWPLMLLVAVLPCVLAVSFLPGRDVRAYLLGSFVVAIAVVVLGLLQDFSGFTADAPVVARNALLIVVTPAIAVLIGLVAMSHKRRLEGALAVATASSEALRAQAAELRASRARVVAAADRERRRIEQDLHDGAQQRLVAIKLHLAQASVECGADPGAAATTLEAIRDEVAAAHRELRDLAQGVYPPVLVEHGPAAALRSVADRFPVPVVLDLPEPWIRAAPDIEATVYFCAVEALQNVAKHAGPHARATLSAGIDHGLVWFEVRDDGVGFDPSAAAEGAGLQNLRDRLYATGGSLQLTTAVGGGARVRGEIPVAVGRSRATAATPAPGAGVAVGGLDRG